MHFGNRLPLLVLLLSWLLVCCLPAALGRALLARDITSNQIPWRVEWAEQVAHGVAPLWDPGSSQGRHLLANPNSGSAYPGTLLFLVLPPELAAAWHGAFHVGLFLLGCYRLSRRCGAGRDAAAMGAAASWAGVVYSMTAFGNSLASLAWLPWAVAEAVRPPRGARATVVRALRAGGFLGVAFLAGEPVSAGLAGLAFAVVAAWRWERPTVLWGVSLAALAAAALAAPVLVPMVAAFPDTVRGTMGTAPAALGADTLRPVRFVELLLAHLLGPPFGGVDGRFWAVASFPWVRYYPLLFVGSMPFLAIAGLKGRTDELRPWFVIAGLGVASSVGLAIAPVEHWLHQMTPLSVLRFGIKLLILPTLATPVLVAAGWEGLRADRRRARAFSLAGIGLLACALPAALAPDGALRPVLTRLYPSSATRLAAVPSATLRRGMLADLAGLALPLGAVAVAGPVPAVAVLAVVAGNALLGEQLLDWESTAQWSAPPAIARHLPRAARLAVLVDGATPSDGPQHPSMAGFWSARAALSPDYGGRWGFSYVLGRGPDGLEPFRQGALMSATQHLQLDDQARIAVALGADAVIAGQALQGMACEAVDAVWVCIPPHSAAPAYLAGRVLQASGMQAALLTLTSAEFRPGADAVIEGAGGVELMSGGRVTSQGGPPHHRRFEVNCSGPGLFVLAQSYVGSWRARVDGRPRPVVPVNGSQLGVRIPSGTRHVELYLDPLPYRLGLAGPLLLVVAALLSVLWRVSPNPAPGLVDPSKHQCPKLPDPGGS